jgi:hypothetical protein
VAEQVGRRRPPGPHVVEVNPLDPGHQAVGATVGRRPDQAGHHAVFGPVIDDVDGHSFIFCIGDRGVFSIVDRGVFADG